MHFGFGAANYEASDEVDLVKRQMIYSFVPAGVALGASSYLLFAHALSIGHVVTAFSSLMITQFVSW